MDLETEKLKARLAALETALVVVARRDPGILQAVLSALNEQHQTLVQTAVSEDGGGFQQGVFTEPRPARDRQIEKIKVEAYSDLLGKVQRSG